MIDIKIIKGIMDLHTDENKVFFIIGSFLGLISQVNNMVLADFFPLILLKAAVIAAVGGFASLFGKYLFQLLMKKIKK